MNVSAAVFSMIVERMIVGFIRFNGYAIRHYFRKKKEEPKKSAASHKITAAFSLVFQNT